MAIQSFGHSDRKYDRDFLLSAHKRNQLIELWEVENTGGIASMTRTTFISTAWHRRSGMSVACAS
jgi:hypothetical protein